MKCAKCGAIIEKFEVFPEGICVKCYAAKFKEEWASAIEGGSKVSEPRIKCLVCKERKTFDQIGEGLICVECQEAK